MINNKSKKLGQFFTPLHIAKDIIQATKQLFPKVKMSILEPAFGQGVFANALLQENINFDEMLGVEIDSTLTFMSQNNIKIINDDFTSLIPTKKFDLLITNPPYTRHHLIDDEQKSKMSKNIKNELGISISGLSGLHSYFILLADKWLKEDAIAIWLLPSEFLDINYGKQIKEYLLNKVELISIHIYDTKTNSLFDNATVSSCVVVYKKTSTPSNNDIVFTCGNKMSSPLQTKHIPRSKLTNCAKWLKLLDDPGIQTDTTITTTLSDFFTIKRGIATGYNDFFVLTKEDIEHKSLPICCFSPILLNTRNISNPIIKNDAKGLPSLQQQLFVLDTDLPIEEIQSEYPNLYEYLLYGLQIGVTNRYLVKKRKIWYKQENRTPAPFYCSYMARMENNSSFKFIWNDSNLIVSNNFLMLYPKECVINSIKNKTLTYDNIYNSLCNIKTDGFKEQTRNYARGLCKIEPRELGKVKFTLNL